MYVCRIQIRHGFTCVKIVLSWIFFSSLCWHTRKSNKREVKMFFIWQFALYYIFFSWILFSLKRKCTCGYVCKCNVKCLKWHKKEYTRLFILVNFVLVVQSYQSPFTSRQYEQVRIDFFRFGRLDARMVSTS